MRFNKLCRSLKITDSREIDLPFHEICAQYNSDRFKFYSQTVSHPNSLKIAHSPHVAFLQLYQQKGKGVWKELKKTPYYLMHQLYGRKYKWIREKAEKFTGVFGSVLGSDPDSIERPVILDRPIVQNTFNAGYEIFEGHHRVAAAFVAGWESIPVQLSSFSLGKNK